GDYTREEYKRALDSAAVAVFLGSFETQGLALAEAWAMDVPTVVWDPRADAEWRGRRFRSGSSCPWLTPETGRTFGNAAGRDRVLAGGVNGATSFHPRQWVLAHMTAAVCAAQLHPVILEALDGRPAAGI